MMTRVWAICCPFSPICVCIGKAIPFRVSWQTHAREVRWFTTAEKFAGVPLLSESRRMRSLSSSATCCSLVRACPACMVVYAGSWSTPHGPACLATQM
eukprot:5144395-Pleurochrysis_carterae.AAC.2